MSMFLNSRKNLETKQVTEIIRVREIMEELVPSNYVKGTINIKGKVIPVMEIGFSLKKDHIELIDNSNIVVIDIKVIDPAENGVVMDVIKKNIDTLGGTYLIKKVRKKGTITMVKLKINLTSIEGLEISAGSIKYIIPINCVKESLKISGKDTIESSSDMITIKGENYPVFLIHKLFNIKTEISSQDKGIMLIMEGYTKSNCQFK